MKIPLVCRSCGQDQDVDLAAAGDVIVCETCGHESSAGERSLRQGIQARHAKTRGLMHLSALLAAVALLLVAARVTVVESHAPEAAYVMVLWIAAGLSFAGSVTFLVLAEKEREVVHF